NGRLDVGGEPRDRLFGVELVGRRVLYVEALAVVHAAAIVQHVEPGVLLDRDGAGLAQGALLDVPLARNDAHDVVLEDDFVDLALADTVAVDGRRWFGLG